MPEVAEMEPKVISEGLNPLPSPCGWVWRRSLLNVYVLLGGKVRLLWVAQRLRKWCSLPRLETRTKESDTDASIVVVNHSAQ